MEQLVCLVWNIAKNARKLGVGRGQFDAGVNGLKDKNIN